MEQSLSVYGKALSSKALLFCFTRLPFTVRLLNSDKEREAYFRLRHDIFHREHHGRTLAGLRDCDEFDAHCDHLGVFENERLVGAYRLNCSLNSRHFYSQKRFDLEPLLALPGVKVEAGRACVVSDRRGSMVLSLLWRGLSAYMTRVGGQFLFGCSSVRFKNPSVIRQLTGKLRAAGFFHSELNVAVRPEFARQWPSRGLQDEAVTVTEPPLMQSYLKAGAKIVAEPAHDRFLGCADFLTLLDWRCLDSRFRKRYDRD